MKDGGKAGGCRWQRPDVEDECVFVWREGQELECARRQRSLDLDHARAVQMKTLIRLWIYRLMNRIYETGLQKGTDLIDSQSRNSTGLQTFNAQSILRCVLVRFGLIVILY